MIHRFEVNPPATTVKIFTSPDSQLTGMVDFDGYVQARMIGGRDELGEYHGPCLITIDDETERGAWELEHIRQRMAAGHLPAVRPYEPEMGVSDDQIEALVERRVAEELRRRGYVEQPSEEAREELARGLDEEPSMDSPRTRYEQPVMRTGFPGPVEVREVPATVIDVEVTRDGRKRCPLDKRLFAPGTPWTNHWTRSTDEEHQRLAGVMIQPAA